MGRCLVIGRNLIAAAVVYVAGGATVCFAGRGVEGGIVHAGRSIVEPVRGASLASNLPLGTVSPVPMNPMEVAAGIKVPSEALKGWLGLWRDGWLAGREVTEEQKGALKEILAKASLTAVEALNLAHAFHFLSGDVPTSMIFYDASSARVEAELGGEGVLRETSLPVLQAILYHLEDFRSVYWPMIETYHQSDAAAGLYRIYNHLIRQADLSGDMEVMKLARRPAIGAAQCLHVLGKYAEARKLLEEIPRMGMSRGDQAVWEWTYSQVLYDLRDFSQASPYLASIAKDKGSENQRSAAKMLVRALAVLGRAGEAEDRLREFLEGGCIGADESLEMQILIESSKVEPVKK